MLSIPNLLSQLRSVKAQVYRQNTEPEPESSLAKPRRARAFNRAEPGSFPSLLFWLSSVVVEETITPPGPKFTQGSHTHTLGFAYVERKPDLFEKTISRLWHFSYFPLLWVIPSAGAPLHNFNGSTITILDTCFLLGIVCLDVCLNKQ